MMRHWGLRPPETLTIAITGACNLACRHCWVRAGEGASCAHVPMVTITRLFKEFAAIGGTGLRITGGEPLCHPHWLDVVRRSRALGFKTVILQTNAMLLTDVQLAELCRLDCPGLMIQISLDGATARSHDLVRGDGAFDGALQGIMRLVRAGLGSRVAIFFTEMRHTIGEFPDLLSLADTLGLGSVASGMLVACGRASGDLLVAPPGPEQYLELLERFKSDAHFRKLYERMGSMAALEWRADDPASERGCTFVENPYLTSTGRLYPCLFCHADEYSVADVFEKSLADVLAQGAPLWSDLLHISRCRGNDLTECRDCPGRQSCAGGCLGRAWGSSHTMLAADDRCGIRRALYPHT